MPNVVVPTHRVGIPTQHSAVCLLSRRMLGSLDRRSLLESVQAVRGRYMHVRTGNARPQPAVPTGAGLKFFCACCSAAGALASLRARAQPPAAPHASRPRGAAASRPPLVTRAAQEMDWPLCLYAAMSLRCYVATLLCRYAATPLCRYAAMSLCRYVAVPRDVHARV